MKSSSLLCEPVFTIYTYMLLRCERYGLHEWAMIRQHSPRLSYTYKHTWATRGELYALIITSRSRQDHLQYTTYMHVRRVWAIFYSLSTHTCFTRVSYGLRMSQLMTGLACAKLRHRQEIKVLHCYRFDIDYVKSVQLPIRPSNSFPIARSVYFPIIRCLWPGFCFGQYRTFSYSLGITHHVLVHCKLSVP